MYLWIKLFSQSAYSQFPYCTHTILRNWKILCNYIINVLFLNKWNIKFWEIEITFPNVFMLVCIRKPVSHRYDKLLMNPAIVSSCVSLCSMALCSKRKLTSKVPFNRSRSSEIHSLKGSLCYKSIFCHNVALDV